MMSLHMCVMPLRTLLVVDDVRRHLDGSCVGMSSVRVKHP